MFNLDDKTQHNWGIVALIIFNFFVYIAMLGFNGAATVQSADNKIFQSSVGNVSDLFFIDITPAGWVFSIVWTTIFIWNLAWLIYAISCLFRRSSDDDSYLYRKFDFFHWGLFIAFSFNNLAIIAWLYLWINLYIGWSLFMIILTVFPLDIAILILSRRIHYLHDKLVEHNLKKDIYLTRILALNGLGFFATWLSLASNLNFAQFLTYQGGAKDGLAATFALLIILILAVVYSLFENFVWHRFLMYLFTPWFVVNFALIGSLAKNWISGAPSRNNIITLILLIVTLILAVIKLVCFFLYRGKWKHKLVRDVRIGTVINGQEMDIQKDNIQVKI